MNLISFEKVMYERFIKFANDYLVINDDVNKYPPNEVETELVIALVESGIFDVQSLEKALYVAKIVLNQKIYDCVKEVLQ